MKWVALVLLCVWLTVCFAGCGEELLSYSFESYDFSQVTEVQVNNLVTLETYTVSEAAEVEKICGFLQTVRSSERISAKGFYGGGTYRVRLYSGEKEIDSIIFYGGDEFDYGEFGDGYPVKYQTSTPTSREVVDFFCQYDVEYDSEDWAEEYLYFAED